MLGEGLMEKVMPDGLFSDEQAFAGWASEESYRKSKWYMQRHSSGDQLRKDSYAITVYINISVGVPRRF